MFTCKKKKKSPWFYDEQNIISEVLAMTVTVPFSLFRFKEIKVLFVLFIHLLGFVKNNKTMPN